MYLGDKVYPEDIECVIDSSEGKGGIYVGNLEASQNLHTLKKYGIKGVLTSANGIHLNHPKTQIPYYLYIPAEDRQTFNISNYFEKACNWIHQTLQQTNILVHCLAGVSRSVSLVIAYLIKHKSMNYDDAYYAIKSRRRIIHPNEGFIKQLKQFQKSCKNQHHHNLYHNHSVTDRLESYSPTKNHKQHYQQYSPPKKYHYDPIQNTKPSSQLQNYQKRYKAFSDYNLAKNNPQTDSFQNLNSELDRKIQQIRNKYRDLTSQNGYSLKKSIPNQLTNYEMKRSTYQQRENYQPTNSRLRKLTSDYQKNTYPDFLGEKYNGLRKLKSYQEY